MKNFHFLKNTLQNIKYRLKKLKTKEVFMLFSLFFILFSLFSNPVLATQTEWEAFKKAYQTVQNTVECQIFYEAKENYFITWQAYQMETEYFFKESQGNTEEKQAWTEARLNLVAKWREYRQSQKACHQKKEYQAYKEAGEAFINKE